MPHETRPSPPWMEILRLITTFLATGLIALAGVVASAWYNKAQIELARIKDVTGLVSKLYSSEPTERRIGAIALSYYGRPAVPVLITLLDDTEETVKQAALNSLELVGDSAVHDLLKLARRTPGRVVDPWKRGRAFVLLGRIGYSGYGDLVRDTLEDRTETDDVKVNLLEAIGDTGDRRFVDSVERLADSVTNQTQSALVMWTAWTLGSLRSERSAPKLAEWIRNEDKGVRYWSYRALGAIGAKAEAEQVCSAAEQETDGDTKLQADEVCRSLKAAKG